MAYEKQGFHSGEKLKASQLSAMEDGIIEAEKLAMEGAAGAANMEKGAGENATQQLPDGVADGFDLTEKNANATALDPTLTGIIPYGATGDFASAFGGKCAAMGKRSHAEGTSTIAKGKYSHAEGDNSVALGNDSHAEGYQTVTGPDATAQHAEGIRTQALGWAAHAEGSDTVAKGNNSHAGGSHTVANHNDQTVIGKYNKNKENTLFEVGNGVDADHKSNAFEVYEDGDIGIYKDGKIYSLQKMLAAYFTDENLK